MGKSSSKATAVDPDTDQKPGITQPEQSTGGFGDLAASGGSRGNGGSNSANSPADDADSTNTSPGENGSAVISGPTYYGIDEISLDQFVVGGTLLETQLQAAFETFREAGFNLISTGVSAGGTALLRGLLRVADATDMQLIIWLNDTCPGRNHASTPWCFVSDTVDPSATDPAAGWDISRGTAAMAIIDAHNQARPDKPTVLGVIATHEPFYSANIQDITDDLSATDSTILDGIYEKIATRVAGLYQRLKAAYPHTDIAVFFTSIAGLNSSETAPYRTYWLTDAENTTGGAVVDTRKGRRMTDIAIIFQHCEQDAAAIAAGQTVFRGGCETVSANNTIDRAFLNGHEELKGITLLFNIQAFGSTCYHKALPTLATLADRACKWAPDVDGLMYYAWDDPTAGTRAADFPIDTLSDSGEQCVPTAAPTGGILGVYEDTLSSAPGDALRELAYDTVFSTDFCNLATE